MEPFREHRNLFYIARFREFWGNVSQIKIAPTADERLVTTLIESEGKYLSRL